MRAFFSATLVAAVLALMSCGSTDPIVGTWASTFSVNDSSGNIWSETQTWTFTSNGMFTETSDSSDSSGPMTGCVNNRTISGTYTDDGVAVLMLNETANNFTMTGCTVPSQNDSGTGSTGTFSYCYEVDGTSLTITFTNGSSVSYDQM